MGSLRLGVIGCDTSHVVEFTRRLNHRDVAPEHWVDGAEVVAAWPGTSRVAPDRLPGYVQTLRDMGIAITERPEQLREHGVDAILLEGQEGDLHAELALPWIRAGVPVFVDKPFACRVADAAAMVEEAARQGVPLLSASALRFVPEAQGLGPISGAWTWSPGHLHPVNPGLFHYGVHGVELLYTLLGPGCRQVSCIRTEGADQVTGEWSDGRLGGVRGLRTAAPGYGLVAFTPKGPRTAVLGTTWIYRDLLRAVIPVLAGGPLPVAPRELVEAVAFSECAEQSVRSGGAPVALPVL